MAEKKIRPSKNNIDYSTSKEEILCYGCQKTIKKYEKYFNGLRNLCEPCAELILKGRQPKGERE